MNVNVAWKKRGDRETRLAQTVLYALKFQDVTENNIVKKGIAIVKYSQVKSSQVYC